MLLSLHENDIYEVLVTGDGTEYGVNPDAWIHMAETLDWDNLPEYLEGVQDHELNRMEAECLETGELSDAYYEELYGGALE